MIKWFAMKKKEIEVKTLVYTYILTFLEEKEDIIVTAQNIFDSVKDKTGSDLQQELVAKLAEIIRDNAEEAKVDVDGE